VSLNKPSLQEIEKDAVKPTAFLDYRLYFRALYLHRKTSGNYSYQKFAEDLGFAPTNIMYQIIQGRRPLTNKAATSVIKALDLEPAEALYLKYLIAFGNARGTAKREEAFHKLQELKKDTLPDEIEKDMLEYFSVWYNPVVWELVGTKGFKADPEWIAKRIYPHLKPVQAKESLELLQRLQLIAYDKEEKMWKQTRNRIVTPHVIKGMALVSYHNSMIDHGKASLTAISGSRRDVSGVTVSVNSETVKKLRAMIHSFQVQLVDEAEKGGIGDEIYQINIQFFPFTA
jgi:uncharacterized protein (TIGR02147 family)